VNESPETRHYYTESHKKEVKKMAKQKQHVFSARTTEDGLKQLNGLKAKLNISWDDLVIDAVCAHYGLDRLAMALPKAYKPDKKSEEKKNGGKGKHGKEGNQEGYSTNHGSLSRCNLRKLAPRRGLEPLT
jgi:hypothetical protein